MERGLSWMEAGAGDRVVVMVVVVVVVVMKLNNLDKKRASVVVHW